jgi:hypothetical protein
MIFRNSGHDRTDLRTLRWVSPRQSYLYTASPAAGPDEVEPLFMNLLPYALVDDTVRRAVTRVNHSGAEVQLPDHTVDAPDRLDARGMRR